MVRPDKAIYCLIAIGVLKKIKYIKRYQKKKKIICPNCDCPSTENLRYTRKRNGINHEPYIYTLLTRMLSRLTKACSVLSSGLNSLASKARITEDEEASENTPDEGTTRTHFTYTQIRSMKPKVG